MPDVKNGAGYGFAGEEVGDGAMHKADTTVGGWVLYDCVSVFTEGRVRGPEGTKDGGGCWVDVSFGYDFVGDFINKTITGQNSYSYEGFSKVNDGLTIPTPGYLRYDELHSWSKLISVRRH